jgi:hypothetical protein
MRITLDDGCGSFRPDERDSVWETIGHASTDVKIDLDIVNLRPTMYQSFTAKMYHHMMCRSVQGTAL